MLCGGGGGGGGGVNYTEVHTCVGIDFILFLCTFYVVHLGLGVGFRYPSLGFCYEELCKCTHKCLVTFKTALLDITHCRNAFVWIRACGERVISCWKIGHPVWNFLLCSQIWAEWYDGCPSP